MTLTNRKWNQNAVIFAHMGDNTENFALGNKKLWPLLLTWFNCNPSMDK